MPARFCVDDMFFALDEMAPNDLPEEKTEMLRMLSWHVAYVTWGKDADGIYQHVEAIGE